MNNTLKASLIALGLLATPMMASAGDVSNSFTTYVNIASQCTLAPVEDVELTVSASSASAFIQKYFVVECNDQLPYTLEINTQAGGLMDVTDTTTNKAYQVKFENANTGLPWGTVANGEELSALGSGFPEAIAYNVRFNSDSAYGKPAVGTYTGTYTATLTFF